MTGEKSTLTMPTNARTQRARILRLLIAARGSWVPLPEIMTCAAQYNALIFELRRLGFQIENRVETNTETGARHSWFRLLPFPTVEAPKPEHAWENRPRVTGLTLFDPGVRQ